MQIRTILTVIFILILFNHWDNGCKAQSGTWYLKWSDEFDYSGEPDGTKWGYDIGGGGWGNQELQYYTNRLENARVEDGKLIITAIKETYESNEYTSARIVSRTKGDWLYGRIEVRAKLPEGRGTWPAIWTLPTDWEYGGWPNSGEIDIMEHVGYDQGTVYGTIHTQANNGMLGNQIGGHVYFDDVSDTFHIYSIEWSKDKIIFIADGSSFFSYPNYHNGSATWPFDKRFHLLMNIAVGGAWGGAQGIDTTVFPQTLEIDYVRVYQKFAQESISGPEEVDASQQGIEFSVSAFEGASYSWTFPEGVTITSGQGTNTILVNWGTVSGTVSVIQSYADESYTSTLDVSVIAAPEGELIIYGNETDLGNWQHVSGTGNSIEMHYEE